MIVRSSESTTSKQRRPEPARSRQSILDRIDSRVVPSPPLPEIDQSAMVHYEDPIATFLEVLKFVGGQAHQVDEPKQVVEILEQIPAYAEATRIASSAPEVVQGNVDPAALEDPHDLASLDWMVARGEFLVAENAAIWIDGSTLPHRVLLFIAQYLAIVVSRQQVVHHLHQAYERIGEPRPGFGVFVSGPSKTADIEQSLVLGAHGCRALQVFLLP
jgi:L-lactate dehydrogenase complex protein LldG